MSWAAIFFAGRRSFLARTATPTARAAMLTKTSACTGRERRRSQEGRREKPDTKRLSPDYAAIGRAGLGYISRNEAKSRENRPAFGRIGPLGRGPTACQSLTD